MGRAVFLYRDYAVTGILSDGNWLPALPLTNAQDPDLGVVARSANASNASTRFRLDLGAAETVGGFVVGPTNISPGASYRIRAYADAAYTALLFDTGIIQVPGGVIDWKTPSNWRPWRSRDFWTGYINVDDTRDLPFYMGHAFASDLFAQYFFVEFFDEGNKYGYIQFGRVLCAKAWRPTLNYAPGSNSLGIQVNTDAQSSIDGNRAYWERQQRRTWTCAFPRLPQNEAFDNVFPMGHLSGISRQIFLIPDPDDVTRYRKRNFLATFKQVPAIAQIEIADEATVLEFEEVL